MLIEYNSFLHNILYLNIIEIESRLAVSQDERRTLLERSLASESKNEKLILENGQLAKKIAELDAASKELSREFQALQVQIK